MFSPRDSARRQHSGLTRRPLTAAKGLSSSPGFGSPGGRVSPVMSPGFSPNRVTAASPRRSLLRRSSLVQAPYSPVIMEGAPHYTMQSFGPSLPVAVMEALTMATAKQQKTVKINEHGWAWLVCGSRLLVWKVSHHCSAKSSLCKELQLPPTTLPWSVELVAVSCHGDRSSFQHISVMVVSRDGALRYWSSLAQVGSFVESFSDCGGVQYKSLRALKNGSFVLASTKSQLWLSSFSETSIQLRPLGQGMSVFSGIGRRVSSVFGFLSSPITESKTICVLVHTESDAVYCLTTSGLHKWEIGQQQERLVLSWDCESLLRERLTHSIWNFDDGDDGMKARAQIRYLDLQSIQGGLIMLVAAWLPDERPCLVNYALVSLCDVGDRIEDDYVIEVLKYTQSGHPDAVACSLLVPDPAGQLAFVYNEEEVFAGSLGTRWTSLVQEKISFSAPGDGLLGGGSVDGQGVFFSLIHGLVVISPCQEESLLPPAVETSLSASVVAHPEDMTALEASLLRGDSNQQDENVEALKMAFLHSCRKDHGMSQSIIEKQFPVEDARVLDLVVARLSETMVDDFPATDPRWTKSVPDEGSGFSHSSLLLLHQLKDKLTAHKVYLSFLCERGILQRLGDARLRDGCPCTARLLCEHAEKLMAAIALKQQHERQPELVARMIRRVLTRRLVSVPENLTPADVFFREVTRIDDIIEVLLEEEDDVLQRCREDMTECTQTVFLVNNIILEMLRKALQYRNQEWYLYALNVQYKANSESISWTEMEVIRNVLCKQHDLVLGQIYPEVDGLSRRSLLDQLVSLVDICLEGYVSQLQWLTESLPLNQERHVAVEAEFSRRRSELLLPYLALGQHERVAVLAEKFCDFDLLVRLCEQTDDQTRLQRYMTQFADKNFSEFLFRWYMEEGKRSKLLNQPIAQHSQLARFLQAHEHIGWLHDIHTQRFGKASSTLRNMASQEKKFFSRKKTLLSLGKLTALASDLPPEELHETLEEIRSEQGFQLYQESLPKSLLDKKDIDVDTMGVLTACELIMLFIDKDNQEANEFDFKKALELLLYVKLDDDSNGVEQELKVKIFSQALLRDDWRAIKRADDPVKAANGSVFGRLLELLMHDDMLLPEFLPHVNVLLGASELRDLARDPVFEFLLRANFEHYAERALLSSTSLATTDTVYYGGEGFGVRLQKIGVEDLHNFKPISLLVNQFVVL
uniref:Nucleoporin 133 n=4 Tax=Eptatretus burgeri TaxID=7764 RepID=A0A8C4WV74_EPTBU